ncbi:hypothetical protein EJP82_22640 [Paenibacillus anaericanus]|uniref:Redoxin domain-containing protein n=1 Tax=Paenibacillus anaericanus TaxID=170367 RepID=A0A3S1EB20_9BACL|nr:hypothetical protein [Paenibacillus anaericanus]RUT41754.1 hypothetical protein EJP82_22640 [Paenibacillus anaericanus]
MRQLFLKLYRYVYFSKVQKNKANPTFLLRDQGLAMGSRFPSMAELFGQTRLKENDGIIILFLSTTCQACIEIFSGINNLSERWSSKEVILLINGDDTEFRNIQRENHIEVPMIKYEHTQFELYKTTIFPFTYYLSHQGIILARGPANYEAQIDVIVNKGIENTQLTRTGGENV